MNRRRRWKFSDRFSVAASPDQLQTQLNISVVVDRIRNRTELRCAEGSIWSCELGRVHDIEELRPKLQGALPFRFEFKVLENCKIEIHLAGSDTGISAKVAEGETCR